MKSEVKIVQQERERKETMGLEIHKVNNESLKMPELPRMRQIDPQKIEMAAKKVVNSIHPHCW